MTARRAALKRVVDSIADGSGDVDWGAVGHEVAGERDQALLRELRILDRISQVQRSQTEVIDESALEGQARIIARIIPIEYRGRPAESAVESPAAEEWRRRAEQTTPEPTRWGRFELLERIGEGAFGEVYRAFDTQLRREVALKLLRVQTAGEERVARMLQEARALARVHHPNVVVVHDADELDGQVGICMELIRGRNLEQILASEGVRSAREAALIGEDLCGALAAVHNAGLLHRDIKAQNVMREDGGRIVLMDFGAGQEQGTPSRLTGTPLYLAPEVLDGRSASVASDVYSVGVLLYHLVTNDFPVRGRSYDELRQAHHEGRIHRLRDLAPTLPRWFIRIVERAIAPNPQDRFATVGELEKALAKPQSPTKYLMLAAAVTLLVGAGAFAMWRASSAADNLTPVVAVLPLDAGPGVERHMADAIGDEIYQGLAMIDTLRVTSPQSAANAKADRLTMRQAASQLGAAAVVAGTVSGLDDEQFEVKLRLFRAGTDASIWADVFQTSRTSLGSFRRTTAQALAHVMKADVSPQVLAKLNRPATTRTDAFDAYARGRSLLARASRSDLEQAQRELERSTSFDPTFAPAYAALARVHLDLGSNGRRSEWTAEAPLARAAANQALALDSELAEAHAVLGQIAFLFDWDWENAERSFRRAMSLNLSDTFSRERYAQYLAARGRVNEAQDVIEEARRLNPYSESTNLVMVAILQYARRFQEAETMTLALRPRAPNQNAVHSQLGRIFAATGRFDRAIEEWQKRTDAASGIAVTEAEIASAQAGAGRIPEAEAMLDRLTERAKSEEISPELFALVSTALGRIDDAFRYLDRAVQQRSRRILWLKVDPRWDPLRSDPRFRALVKQTGL